MLISTYIHAPGVGPATERSLWRQGAATWQEFLADPAGWRLANKQREQLGETILQSMEHLENGNVGFFAQTLPQREHWRAVPAFERWGFLDIETDGGYGDDAVTLVGLYDGREMRTYMRDENLIEFSYDCRNFDGFITFFGAGFDLPMLTRRFPTLCRVFAERLHIDLCPLLKRLGHSGGLKSIERQLGIARSAETDGLSGWDAVRLWRLAQKGGHEGQSARDLLLAYNREDVMNLPCLLNYALPRLRALVDAPAAPR